MAAASEELSHLQARFFTKQEQYAVPDSPFSVPAAVTVTELASLINKLLDQDVADDEDEHRKVDFDFLIDGEFLRLALGKHLEEKGISSETVVEIEYVEKQPAPEPVGSVLHDDWVSSVQASGDWILTGSYDNAVRIWNHEGENLATLQYHSDPVKCVRWIKKDGPVNLLVSGSHDNTLVIWEWNEKNNKHKCLHSLRGHERSVDCIAIDPTLTRMCSGSFDKKIKIWSAVPGEGEDEPSEIQEQQRKKTKLDGRKPLTRTPMMTLEGHKEAVSSLVWLGDRELVSASWDHTMIVWDMEHVTQKATLTGTKVFLSVSYSSLNQLLATGSADRHVRLWDPRQKDGTIVKTSLTHHKGWVSSVAWSPVSEHQLISGSYDNTLKLWDIRSPSAPLYNMSGIEDKVLCLDWTIPELFVTGGADNCLHVFKANNIQQFAATSATSSSIETTDMEQDQR